MSNPLDGKAAIVTGGSRGIGAAVALRLARDGADVAITYQSSADRAEQVVEQIKQLGSRAIAIETAGDASTVTAAVDRAAAEFGRLDILVNNAGIMAFGPVGELDADDFDQIVDTNVRAVFLAVRAALPHLGDSGRIINIGSNLAERNGQPGMSLYSLTKSALIGFTKALAHDLGPRGITANVVQPGNTDTDMNPADSERGRQTLDQIPLGRYGTPDDVAATVAHLAGDGGRQISGTTITIDGGQNA